MIDIKETIAVSDLNIVPPRFLAFHIKNANGNGFYGEKLQERRWPPLWISDSATRFILTKKDISPEVGITSSNWETSLASSEYCLWME